MLSAAPCWENREGNGEPSSGRSLYNLYRTYDLSTGRYLEMDPLGQADALNRYSYARQNPVSWIDPMGLISASVGLISGSGFYLMDPEARQRNCAINRFVANYVAMQRANWKKSDKYFHCKANCEAAKCGPYGCEEAAELSDYREWFDQNIKGDLPIDSALDQSANWHGRYFGVASPAQPCSVSCAPFRPRGLPASY